MFLVWRGWGLLAAAYPIVAVIVAAVAADAIFGRGTYQPSTVWPGLAILVAGLLCWFTGRRINGEPVPYLARNATDDEPFRPRVPFLFARHNLFFIPLEAWGALMLVVGGIAIGRAVFGI